MKTIGRVDIPQKAFMVIPEPCQVLRSGRRLVYRLLAWNLVSNWAYIVMASLAWSLKAKHEVYGAAAREHSADMRAGVRVRLP